MTLSYWLQASTPTYPALQGDQRADCLIIGAGLTGSAVAFFLRESGLRICVVEKDVLCGGASGRNTGFIISGLGEHYSGSIDFWGRENARTITKIHRANHELLASLIRDQPIECAYRRNGSFAVAGDEQEETVLRKSYTLMREDGIDCEFHESEVLGSTLHSRGFLGGIYNPQDGAVNPAALVRGLAESARRAGVLYYERTPLSPPRRDGDGWRLDGPGGSISAPLVFCCINAWTPLFFPALRIRAVRGQCLSLDASVDPVPDYPCIVNYGSEYWRGVNGAFLIGGRRSAAPSSEIGYRDEVTDRIQDAILEFCRRHFPRLQGAPVSFRWSGVMAYTGDGLPYIGEIPGFENIFLAAGYTGHGFGYALLAARWLVDLALEERDSIPELFRIGRVVRESPALSDL